MLGATLSLTTGVAAPADLHPAERACLRAALSGRVTFSVACRLMQPLAAQTGRRLMRAGLAADPADMSHGRAALLMGTWLFLVVALERFAHGMIAFRPVGFLGGLALLDAWLMVRVVAYRERPTPRGRSVVDKVVEAVLPPRRNPPRLSAASLTNLSMSIALLGAPALMAEPRFAGIEFGVDREGVRGSGSDGGGCGSGDGGGGGCGGGGCGGCGS